MDERSDETVRIELASSEQAPQQARTFLRDTLGTWRLDGFGQVTELLADELVANVVRHVGQPMELRAVRRPASIRIELDDASTEPPVVRTPEPFQETGRGILLIESLATAWGVDVRDEGKTVWFEIDVATATEEVHGSD